MQGSAISVTLLRHIYWISMISMMSLVSTRIQLSYQIPMESLWHLYLSMTLWPLWEFLGFADGHWASDAFLVYIQKNPTLLQGFLHSASHSSLGSSGHPFLTFFLSFSEFLSLLYVSFSLSFFCKPPLIVFAFILSHHTKKKNNTIPTYVQYLYKK